MLLTADRNKKKNEHKDQKMYLPQMFWTVKSFLPWFKQIRPKAEIQQVGTFFCTQFPSLEIFINKKVGNRKNKTT